MDVDALCYEKPPTTCADGAMLNSRVSVLAAIGTKLPRRRTKNSGADAKSDPLTVMPMPASPVVAAVIAVVRIVAPTAMAVPMRVASFGCRHKRRE